MYRAECLGQLILKPVDKLPDVLLVDQIDGKLRGIRE
jgi:hypothetical protein